MPFIPPFPLSHTHTHMLFLHLSAVPSLLGITLLLILCFTPFPVTCVPGCWHIGITMSFSSCVRCIPSLFLIHCREGKTEGACGGGKAAGRGRQLKAHSESCLVGGNPHTCLHRVLLLLKGYRQPKWKRPLLCCKALPIHLSSFWCSSKSSEPKSHLFLLPWQDLRSSYWAGLGWTVEQ